MWWLAITKVEHAGWMGKGGGIVVMDSQKIDIVLGQYRDEKALPFRRASRLVRILLGSANKCIIDEASVHTEGLCAVM